MRKWHETRRASCLLCIWTGIFSENHEATYIGRREREPWTYELGIFVNVLERE